ncbi:MAG: DeoR/GlpR family DNA-binding transcription regulator [Cetobacterium sp.]
MFVEERKQKILNILKQKEKVSVNELSNLFSLSKVIIRKDLCNMEEENLLIRTHGGAILKKKIIQSSSLKKLGKTELEIKLKIAQKSISLIEERDIIFLDSCDINLIIAELLQKEKIKISVITNHLEIQSILSSNINIEVISLGGIYNHKSNSFIGDITRQNLEMFNTNKAFIGASGINVDNLQMSTSSIEVGILQKTGIDFAKSVYILATSQIFLQDSIFNFSKLKANMSIITDSEISTEIEEKLIKNNINVIK